ncbi:MAG TPA: hypothetical protein VH280_25345 [Verrucomicrobiae bacterium]|jgi:hypothetical protein|nr:hypothetical protein [Verrucomicrobiae bacterium]
MREKPKLVGVTIGLIIGFLWPVAVHAEIIDVVVSTNAAPRVEFGAQKLITALNAANLDAEIVHSETAFRQAIYLDRPHESSIAHEGFQFDLTQNNGLAISSGDDSGLLYGCLELAKRIRVEGKLPTVEIENFHDSPVMKLRGTCIGLQKTYILPGRHVYEYPITPELFPWFYDKQMWTEYLDFLVKNRMNTLYLWSGHPFASLIKLKDYPHAVEVPDDVFQKNQEMYRWLAAECDKRGIWLVQMFYNILVSKPFAETNNISTQLSAPTPLVSDYTRKSVAEFVKEYPNVGLLVCLGEALRGTANQVEWSTNVILPGVLDGMRAAHLNEEPPIVIRTHAMDPYAVMPASYQIYSNLFTMTKYNGESLTTWQPRGKDQAIQLAMAKLGSHLVNIHLLSNLEPFRYGDVEFIKKCVQASRDRLGASGIHVYPLSYWNWPYSPDITAPQELQWQRDWIWFEAWARYSWNPDIPENEDHAYWVSRLAEHYGNTNAAEKILEAYDDAGEVAPRLVRRFGITEGNRQTLSLGMTLDELVNPKKYGAIEDLWLSQSPPGERLDEYVKKEWNHQPHAGETPETIIADVLEESSNAVAAADSAVKLVTKNRDEFGRLDNDIICNQAMAASYSEKVRAAELVLRYDYSHDIADMEQAEKYLTTSLRDYQILTERTIGTYHYANAMQTSQRKIPVPGGIGRTPANYLWSQLLPLYQKELADFQIKVARLKEGSTTMDDSKIKPWLPAAFKLISTNAEIYKVAVGAKVFSDRDFEIEKLAPQLNGLTGIRFSHEAAKKGRYKPVEIEVSEPVRVLVGYFDSNQKAWLQPPQLETDARADDRGGVEAVIENAATITGCPSVNVHAYYYDPGLQKLEFSGKGSFVILGVVPQSAK